VIGDPALLRISKKYSSPPVGEEEGGRGAKLLPPTPTKGGRFLVKMHREEGEFVYSFIEICVTQRDCISEFSQKSLDKR
jgi:hypothetical protein